MTARVSITKTLRCQPSELTVSTLRSFLDTEDGDAKVSVKTDHADRPGELGQVTVTITGGEQT